MKKILTLIFLSSIFNLAFSQSMQLAMQYYNNEEYEKAEVIFENLYKKRKAIYYFDYYIDCLLLQEKFNLAERKTNREIRRNPKKIAFRVTLGYIYRKQNKDTQADNEFKSVYKNIGKNKPEIISVGNSLIRKNEYEWAEKIYITGEDFFPGEFLQSLANVYAYQRKYNLMVEKYLDFVELDYSKISTVKRIFKSYMNHDVNDEFTSILENSLIKRVQKRNNKDVFYELLIWFYLQKSNFYSALIYAKAIDKRNTENGVRVFRIGQKAYDNDDFETANKAYNYVVNKGKNLPYYNNAKFALLKVMYKQVENNQINTPDEIKKVENQYLQIISESGISNKTVALIVDLAHLQGFFLNKEEEAISLLKEALQINGLSDKFKSEFLLELADIYVHANKPWDAVLCYGKIEKDFPNLQITDKAKFRKAKTYFYLGQFGWAQDQWDILKGSPSKLIANDAIYWSNFIDENAGQDTNYKALKTYARADFKLFTGQYSKALLISDSIVKNFSGDNIVPFTYHLKYRIYMQTKEYQKAAMNLEKIVQQYSYAIWADKAVFELAQLYENKLNNKTKAAELYKKILFDYKGSFYTDKARKRYRALSEA